MLGKSFRATGSRNSMKGTMMNTRKGRSLKTSAHVLRNWGENMEELELKLSPLVLCVLKKYGDLSYRSCVWIVNK